MSANINTSVKVAVRVRPMVASEISKGCRSIVEVENDKQVIVKNAYKESGFTYNYAFDSDKGQTDFYNKTVEPMLASLFMGYNVTVLAYGQTGSGKTHTMGTSCDQDVDLGVIPRAVRDIFNYVRDNFSYDITVTVSFLELYQEGLYDLLSDKPRNQCLLEIREDSKGTVISQLTEITVNSLEDVMNILKKGSSGRATGATNMNAHSSRSHAIFTINLSMLARNNSGENKQAKLNLVDLAGSERLKKTGAVGTTLREGININKGLLVLGNVISCLGDEKMKNGHIPYRDSNLTRLLKDSLGGNSITLMIACVSPADYNLDETLSTLRYADKAKKIQNKPVVNRDPKLAEINELKRTIQQLKLQIVGQGGPIVNVEEIDALKRENVELNLKLKQLSVQLSEVITNNSGLHEKIILLQNYNDLLSKKITHIKEQYDVAFEQIRQGIANNDIEGVKASFHQLQHIHDYFEQTSTEQREVEQEIQSQEKDAAQMLLFKKSFDNSIDKDWALELEEKQEKHTNQQVKLNEELIHIQRDLAAKEALAKMLLENNKSIVDIKDMAENEVKIAQLEKEKEELLKKLKQAGNTGKVSEHHRKRVQELEVQLADLNKKVKEQAHLLKIKEKESLRINKLNQEILQMKQTKVKLIRAMREEANKYKQWRLQKERECAKLKQQERKKDNELVKMKTMHDKQQIVYRRRVEQAEAVNRRLKNALALRQQVHEAKKGKQEEKLDSWLRQEYEIFVGVVEAEATLQILLEDRAALQQILEKLKASEEDDSAQIKAIEEDLDTRSVQIQELQQKILDSDEENRATVRYDKFQTMVEAKHGLKFLFCQAAESHKAKVQALAKVNEIMESCNEANEKNNALTATIEELKEQHKMELLEQEKVYQEKIAVLLNHVKDTGGDSSDNMQQIYHDRLKFAEEQNETLQKQIQELQKENEILRTEANKENDVPKSEDPPTVPEIVVSDTEPYITPPKRKKLKTVHNEDSFRDDIEKDPDWRATPLGRRVLEQKRKTVLPMPTKRSSGGGCTCKGNCGKRCGCRRSARICDSSCKCTNCENREDCSVSTTDSGPSTRNSNNAEVPEKKLKKGRLHATHIKL